ncbi:MAG: hypothetical protein CMI54_07295 [Parcubacteria group bacterium]|jgi:hypothetical protein|nr:hypothetical protein [Parcubacteria group bacterium]
MTDRISTGKKVDDLLERIGVLNQQFDALHNLIQQIYTMVYTVTKPRSHTNFTTPERRTFSDRRTYIRDIEGGVRTDTRRKHDE